MKIKIPNVKYNLLLDATQIKNTATCNKCLAFLILCILFVPVITLLIIHCYTTTYGINEQTLSRAESYAIDEYLHKNFIGKKINNELDTITQEEQKVHRKLVCYYAYPSSLNDSSLLLPENIDCNLCTHINIAFATVKNHTINLSENIKNTIPKVTDLRKCNSDLKLLLSVGGGGANSGFPEMIATHATRKEFIKSIKSVLEEYKLDGIDLDWEFPGISASYTHRMKTAKEMLFLKQKQHFSQLVREIRTEYIREKRDYLLTVAVASPKFIVDAAYDVDQLNLYVDFVNLMTYDFHYYTPLTPFTGFNAPLYGMKSDFFYMASLNINYTVHMWLEKGMDREKIIVGLPTYGHSFKLVNPNNSDPGSPANDFGKTGSQGFVDYIEVCRIIANNPNITEFSNETMSPYLHKDLDWVSFENPESMSIKGKYIKDNYFGGAMVYSLNADDYSGSCKLENEKKFHLTGVLNNILIDRDL